MLNERSPCVLSFALCRRAKRPQHGASNKRSNIMNPRQGHTLATLLLLTVTSVLGQEIAITVDDLPFASGQAAPLSAADVKQAQLANRAILHALQRHRIPATGFVTEQRAEQLGLSASRKMLLPWTRPGLDLGNHLYSHADVNSLSVEEIEREITQGETTLTALLKQVGRRPQFFRFPYNHTGDTKEKHDTVAAFLSARGYRMPPCTIDNSDYEFNQTYALALSLQDEKALARIKDDYLAYTGAEIDWYTELHKQVLGYEPPHIMLLHDNLLNAATIEQVLALFQQRGYRFVSLAEALRDPAYAIPETHVTKYGTMWGYRWAQEKQIKVNGSKELEPPAWIGQYRKQHRLTCAATHVSRYVAAVFMLRSQSSHWIGARSATAAVT